MKKRLLSQRLGAATVAALSIFAADSIKAQTTGEFNGFQWYKSGEEMWIVGYSGADRDITVPTVINGYPVKRVENWAFGNLPLSRVTMKHNIVKIGDLAFYGCTNLTSITIPNSVTNLGAAAFQNSGLKSVSLGSGLQEISSSVFQGCSQLGNTIIPQNITRLGVDAFYGCTNITKVNIPSSVIDMQPAAFANCTSLTNVCFEGNAPGNGGGTQFFGDTKLTTIFYISGTEGWGAYYAGIPTAPCSECGIVITSPTMTGSIIDPIDLKSTSATNLALVIHGWTPIISPTPFSGDAAMPKLAGELENRFQQEGQSTNWDVRFYDWNNFSKNTAQGAVRNAVNIGAQTGKQIADAGHYKKVLLVSHSAGTWLANEIATVLTVNNIQSSVTFLDAFVPSLCTNFQSESGVWADSNYQPEALGKYAQMAEQYFAQSPTGFGIGNALQNAVNYDITGIQGCADNFTSALFDSHGWPIRWYTHTAQDPQWELGYGLGYPKAFNITGAKGSVTNLLCGEAYVAPAMLQQSHAAASILQLADTAAPSNYSSLIELIMPPPVPLLTLAKAKRDLLLDEAVVTPLSMDASSSLESSVANTKASAVDIQLSGAEFAFTNLNVLAQGGIGSISTNTNGVELSTTNYVWEVFNLATTNTITLGMLDYALSNQCNSVVGLWMDGQPLTFIQSAPENEKSSLEIFPLSTALGAGNHSLTVSLESLDGSPISATIKKAGFYFAVSPPVITSQSMSNTGDFELSWEVAGGLKYQPQYNNDLTSANWSNLEGLRTSPTNAVMSAFDAINTNQQRFYRVKLEQ